MRNESIFRIRNCFLVLLCVLGFVVEANVRADEVTVFAAASLTDSLRTIAADYQTERGTKISFNFAASSFLARQIEEGAPADIFFSADEAKMDGLEKRGLILNDTRNSLLGNSLVIVVAADSTLQIKSPEDLLQPKVKQIALADPKAVPAGIYSKTFLAKLGLWDRLQPKVVPTANVRAALAAVESGNVEAGMVYSTDAGISKKIKIAYRVPGSAGPKISYPIAVVKSSEHRESAKQFLEYLRSPKASAIFIQYGFLILPTAKANEH